MGFLLFSLRNCLFTYFVVASVVVDREKVLPIIPLLIHSLEGDSPRLSISKEVLRYATIVKIEEIVPPFLEFSLVLIILLSNERPNYFLVHCEGDPLKQRPLRLKGRRPKLRIINWMYKK
jgi:hypothetical protein